MTVSRTSGVTSATEAIRALGDLFKPQSAADVYAGQKAKAARAEAEAHDRARATIENMDMGQDEVDRALLLLGKDANDTYYNVNAGNATQLQGYEIQADTSKHNAQLQANASLQNAEIGARTDAFRTLANPSGHGAVQGGLIPGLGAVGPQGAVDPTTDELTARILSTMDPQQALANGISKADTVEVVGPDGKPRIVTAGEAVQSGMQPYQAPSASGASSMVAVRAPNGQGGFRETSAYQGVDPLTGNPTFLEASTGAPLPAGTIEMKISADSSNLTSTATTNAQQRVMAYDGVSRNVASIQEMIRKNPGIAGLKGDAQGIVQSAGQIGVEFMDIFNSAQSEASQTVSMGGASADAVAALRDVAFNPNIPKLQAFMELTAFNVARATNPTGSITNADFQSARRTLGLDGIKSEADVLARLSAVTDWVSGMAAADRQHLGQGIPSQAPNTVRDLTEGPGGAVKFDIPDMNGQEQPAQPAPTSVPSSAGNINFRIIR